MRRGRTQAHENTVPVAREWWCNGVTNCPQSVFSRQRRRERGGSVPGSARIQLPGSWTRLHAGGVQTQEPAEENPWQLAKDFRVSGTETRSTRRCTENLDASVKSPCPPCLSGEQDV